MNKKAYFLVFLCFLIGGCAKYHPHELKKPLGESQEKNNVKIAAGLLNEKDSQYYFSRNTLKKGYQPIQVYIKNNSEKTYVLKSDNIDLKIERSKDVANNLKLNTTKRAGIYAVAGLFVGIFFIPAIVEGIKSSGANKKLNSDFSTEKFIDSQSRITIKPHSNINSVIFVRIENIQRNFDLTLIEKVSKQKITFNLDV